MYSWQNRILLNNKSGIVNNSVIPVSSVLTGNHSLAEVVLGEEDSINDTLIIFSMSSGCLLYNKFERFFFKL